MKEFFEFLARRGLTPSTLDEEIGTWTTVDTADFVAECAQRLPRVKSKASSVFDYIANSQLGGAPYPCFARECRLANVDALARFAALYADRVLIPDPYPLQSVLPTSSKDYAIDKEGLANDLHVFYYLRPLLEAGLIAIADSRFWLCPKHASLHARKLEAFEQKLSSIEAFLREQYLRETKCTIRAFGDRWRAELTGPEHLFEHSVSVVLLKELPQQLVGRIDPSQQYELTRADMDRTGLLDTPIGTTMRDISLQNMYSYFYGTNYVTNRTLDFDLVPLLNDPGTNVYSKAFSEGLSHSVPLVLDVGLEHLLRLRREHGESFRVYRDAVSAVLRSIRTPDVKFIRQRLDDEIRPELNRIELVIKNEKQLLTNSLRDDVLLGTGCISIAILSGTVSPTISAVFGAIGGLEFLKGIWPKVRSLWREPAQVRDNKYYFLWKLHREGYKQGPPRG